MVRVCIIGAGPCGMAAAYMFAQMDSPPEFVCYEKQETWGGLWNLTWRTGTDQYGEPNHGGMYKYLWSNGPKEVLEYPDYTFEQHFGKPIPSFPPRAVLKDYLEGRWKSSKRDLKQFMKFNHAVRNVKYRDQSDDFVVTVENLAEQERVDEEFSHVIVAVGIFNVPSTPTFPGMDTFHGRVIHSHDFRDAVEFKDQRLLLVGASYSAEDIALQCYKYGAKRVICTWRSKPMGFKWPEGIEERPLLQRLDGNTAYFKDGSSAEVDNLILCTGYKYSFPFMENKLRLHSALTLYPDDLYKGTLWMKGGNNKVFYLGVQDQYFTYTMFESHALWACKYIMGQLKDERTQTREGMEEDIKKWRTKNDKLENCHDDIEFQTDFLVDLCKATGYDERCGEGKELLHRWEHDKDTDILTYRDKSFQSIFTKTASPKHVPWLGAFEDSIEAFVK